MGEQLDFVDKTILFNHTAGTTGEKYDVRKLCLYIGLILEETEETLDAFQNEREDTGLSALRTQMKAMSGYFKKGLYDHMGAQEDVNLEKLGDGMGDSAVVNIGGLIASAWKVQDVLHEIADSNLSKFVDDGTGKLVALLDENGKIKKGDGYYEPELLQHHKG